MAEICKEGKYVIFGVLTLRCYVFQDKLTMFKQLCGIPIVDNFWEFFGTIWMNSGTLAEVCKEGKYVIFGVPGAFTPG